MRTELVALLLASSAAVAENPVTYQGRLLDDGVPVTDVVDLRFTLLDGDGNPLAQAPVDVSGVQVVMGLFTASLDFVPSELATPDAQIRVSVRYADPAPDPFTDLSPTQPLSPAPVALEARTVTSTEGVLAMEPNWDAYGGVWERPRATKSGDMVHLSGLIRRFNSSVFFSGVVATLPRELSPVHNQVFIVWHSSGGPRRLDVRADGSIELSGDTPVGGWFSLSGISYPLTP
ncbi:MAG: hypothetical protein AAGI53_17640 [Planctomycetota bacterium]